MAQIPPELTVQMREVIVHMDNLHISGVMFPSHAVKPMFCRDTAPLEDAKTETSSEALDSITRKLNVTGCTVKIIRCDK